MSTRSWVPGRLARVRVGLLFAGLVGLAITGAQAGERGRGEAAESEARKERAVRERAEPRTEVEAMERRLEELKRRIHALAEEGKREEAGELEREAREVAQNLDRARARGAEAGAREGRPDPDREEIERRLRHMRVAAENLAAAGMEDAAHRILQESEAMERRLREGGGRPGAQPPQAPPEALRRHVEELTGVVRELRQQVERMQQELRSLRERGGETAPRGPREPR
ncbi:MAG: hypothetical protein FJ221_04200 [Lentisphaerae bacterium]|nr:hypothetical protein [Lentisphaerota bacterium]